MGGTRLLFIPISVFALFVLPTIVHAKCEIPQIVALVKTHNLRTETNKEARAEFKKFIVKECRGLVGGDSNCSILQVIDMAASGKSVKKIADSCKN